MQSPNSGTGKTGSESQSSHKQPLNGTSDTTRHPPTDIVHLLLVTNLTFAIHVNHYTKLCNCLPFLCFEIRWS